MQTQDQPPFEITSPNGRLAVRLETGAQLRWSLAFDGAPLLLPSPLALRLQGGETLGANARVTAHAVEAVEQTFAAVHYRRAQVRDAFTRLRVDFEGGYALELRAYDDAAAYRFITGRPGELVIENEVASFNFPADHHAFIPYMWDYRDGEIFNSSFEAQYAEHPLSQFQQGSLAFLPVLVDVGGGKKLVLLEADLEDYPGMYLNLNETGMGLSGVFAAYPLETRQGGYNQMNSIPTRRADFIARTAGTRAFPWRVAALGERDRDLLGNDIVQKLASPPRLDDYSWVNPGQVAWDWWHDYNLSHVDFVAGMNTPTFLHHIDFAAENNAGHIILDAGWSETFDLNAVNPEVDLEEILAYAKSKGVGVILWAAWFTILQQMHQVFPKYAAMGVQGWKIDFIDRDDQVAVASTYQIAELAARYRLMVDYHGVFKPTGLQRTYPNVVGYEGVYGLENYKWADYDAPRYDVSIPYIRNMAGPMDYTSGALTNVTQANFKARNHAPMSKGTRCHQLAMYVIFEAPLQMLSDSPTAYRREPECTAFITRIPTFFDDTVPLDGQVGEFAAVARQKDGVWHLGAMTNWTPRDLTLDLSFLPAGRYRAVIFQDGVNAHREGTDYKMVETTLEAGGRLLIHLAPGGGWAARLERLD